MSYTDNMNLFKNTCFNWGSRIYNTLKDSQKDKYKSKYINTESQLIKLINIDTDNKFSKTMESTHMTMAMESINPNINLSASEIYNLYNIATSSILEGFMSNVKNES